MSGLKTVAEDLAALDSTDEKYISPWTPEQKASSEQELAATKGVGTSGLNAYIAYGSSCGFAGSGSEAYAVNKLTNANVNATVRVKWQQGINNGQYDTVVSIPAGSRRYVGCTRGGGVEYAQYSYSIVGTVP